MRAWAIWQFIKTVVLTSAAAVVMWFVSGDGILPIYVNIFLKTVSVVIFLLGILLAVLKDLKTRIYECSVCHHRFSPDMKNGWKQKCPSCGAPAEYVDRDIPDGRNT